MNTKDSNWLVKCKHIVASQHGEDGVIEKIFEIITPTNKWCIEFGAADGKTLSNTWNLIKNKNWKSVQIESSIDKYRILVQEYKENSVFCLNKAVGSQPPNLLEEMLSPYDIPYNFDFLSIDVDSIDYQIWKTFTKYQPRVVCIECCPDCRNGEIHIHGEWPKHIGSSLGSITLLGKEKGYELIGTIGVNAFFVPKELYSLFELKDNSISNYEIYTANEMI